MAASSGYGRTSYMNSVNDTCNTSYDCGICHVDPRGGGSLNADGRGYKESGNDPCYFCPEVCGTPACTDADGDGYFAESGCGTSVDCDDPDCIGSKPSR